jgi:hypothetical protein
MEKSCDVLKKLFTRHKMSKLVDNIVHVPTGKCLHGNYGDILLVDCNEADNTQRVTMTNYTDQNTGHELFINNVHIDTWKDRLYNSNQCGKGNDCSFHVKNQVGLSGAGQGPFSFYGWGSDWRVVPEAGTNKVIQKAQYGEEGWWITLGEKKECDVYGIPLRECTPTNRGDCTKYNNWKRDEMDHILVSKSVGNLLF